MRRAIARAATSLAFTLAAASAIVAVPHRVAAQPLAPKRSLALGVAPGCPRDAAPLTAVSRRDAAEARRLAASGQEATLVGDQAAARDAFLQAAALDPSDERIAYDLGRALEALGDTARAVDAFCRFLAITPDGRDAEDVRTRLGRLVPADERRRLDDAQVAFQLGVGHLDDGRWRDALAAFDAASRAVPDAPAIRFNGALALAGLGRRDEARGALETYLATAPTVEERVAVSRALDLLRRPVYSPTGAFLRGVVPGLGQAYTGLPLRGALVFGLAGTALALAAREQVTEREVAYVDPNGFPAPYTERTRERPLLVAGVAAAAGVTLAAAIEAALAARSSRRGAAIVAPPAARTRTSLAPWVTPSGGMGVAVRLAGAFGAR